MDKNIYFSYMRETTEKVFPFIDKYLEQIKKIDSDLYKIVAFFIDKRRGKLLLKPFLLRLSYEICGGKEWEETIPICAVFELLNISSYQANSSFDNKVGILTLKDKNSQFIASMITRELCNDMLSEMVKGRTKESLSIIVDLISRSNKNIYIAQHYDLNVLTIENLSRYINDESLFMEAYINRCYYGSGIFNGDCAFAGGVLYGATNSQLQALRYFGENYGIGLQIMNDLADFIPAGVDDIVNRSFQDQFSDLQNGRLTLSLYRLFTMRAKNVEWVLDKSMRNEKFSSDELNQVTNIIVTERIVDFVKSLSLKYAKKAKRSLCVFPDDETKKLLSVMTSICYENKYLKCFPKIREAVQDNKVNYSLNTL